MYTVIMEKSWNDGVEGTLVIIKIKIVNKSKTSLYEMTPVTLSELIVEVN